MRLTKVLLLITIVITTHGYMSAQQGTRYFDAFWQETTPDNALYYRPVPEKNDSGYVLKDYYMHTTQLQGVAFSRTGKEEDFEGQMLWYHTNGTLSQEMFKANGMLQGKASWYDSNGQLIASGKYLDNEPFEGVFLTIIDYVHQLLTYEQGEVKSMLIFDPKAESKAKVEITVIDEENLRYDYYDNDGKFMGSSSGYDSDTLLDGIIVSYGFYPMTVKSITTKAKGEIVNPTRHFYASGIVKQEDFYSPVEEGYSYASIESSLFYNPDGTKMGSLTYDIYSPDNGVHFVFYDSDSISVCDKIEKIAHYKDGKLHGEKKWYTGNNQFVITENYEEDELVGEKIVSDTKGQVIYRLSTEYGLPYNGTTMEDDELVSYTNGEKVKVISFFSNGSTKSEMNTIDNIQNYRFFDLQGQLLGEFRIDEDYTYNGAYVEYDNDLIHSITVYKDDVELEKKEYLNGKLISDKVYNGEATFYDINTGEKFTCDFKDGEPQNGTLLSYGYLLSYVAEKLPYLNGELHGTVETYEYNYYEDTSYLSETIQYENGLKHGIASYFNEGGLYKSVPFQNGEVHGSVTYLIEDETYTATFENDLPINGAVIEEEYNGLIVSISNYSNGLKHGSSQFIDNARIEVYEYGLLEGVKTVNPYGDYSELYLAMKDGEPFSGQIFEEETLNSYENGLHLSSIAYENEAISEVSELKNGHWHTKAYYADGQLKSSFSKTNETINGEAVWLSNKGKTMAKGIYSEGVPVSGSFIFEHSYYDDNYILMTIKSKSVNAKGYEDGQLVYDLTSTKTSSNQTNIELISQFITVLRDKDYSYELPDIY